MRWLNQNFRLRMITTPFSLNNKKILITGASSGIGRETAVQCSNMGAVIIAAGRNSDRLKQTLSMLEGSDHHTIIADITQDPDTITEQLPVLDGIVHSAGILSIAPFAHLSTEELQRIMQVNFFSPVLLTREILKKKKLSRNSSIVFISSLAGNVIASKGNSAYCASKTALTGLAKVLALELAARGTRVNCLLPGMVRTEMMNSFLESFSPEQILEDEKKYPLGYGSAQDVANAAVYFLSDASKWVTGASLIMDGGFSLQ